MQIKIEKAKREDITSIIELNKALVDFHTKFHPHYYKPSKKTQRGIKKYLLKILRKKNFRILVAKDNGEVIGYFIGAIEKSKPWVVPKKIGRIFDAFIDERYRRKSIGRKMFKELIKWFRANKIRNILLSVDTKNKIGIAAWKKYGFFEFQKKMRLDL